MNLFKWLWPFKVMNLFKRLWRFKGTLSDATLHNWLTSGRVYMPGIPIGVTVDARHSPVGFDLTIVKDAGKCEKKSIGVIAAQGFGKTFFANLYLIACLALDVGDDNQRARARYPSIKRNDGIPETAPLVEGILKGKVISPLEIKLNPLARALGMTFEEQYVMVEAMFQYKIGEKLTILDHDLLSQNLRNVYYNATQPSFDALSDSLENFRIDPTANNLHPTLEQRFENEVYASIFKLKKISDLFRSGVYGRIFSGNGEEFVSLIEQRIVSIDLKGVDDDVRSLIEIVTNALDTSAIMPDPDLDPSDPNYGKPKFPNRIPTNITQDEAYNIWANLHSARSEYRRLKTQREHGITTVTLFHRLSDLQNAIGTADSEQARLANNALNEIEVWMIGRQTKKELPVIRQFFDLPEYVIQSLPTLAKGHFWVVVPWHSAPFEIVVIGSSMEVAAFNTDQANHKLMRKYRETGKVQYYLDFLDETTPEINDDGELVES